MKKAQSIVSVMSALILLIGGTVAVYILMSYAYEISPYKKYKDFCDNHSNICYCDFGSCEFKTSSMSSSSYSCIDGNCTDVKYSNVTLSKDTQELCNLAQSMNDKKMLFKAGCI